MSDTQISFAQARQENDERLLAHLDDLRSGKDLKILEPFARAYLGLFYEIDKALSPAERVAELANSEVSEAVLDGFVAALQRKDFPTPAEIGAALGEEQSLPNGYVILAGLDRLARETAQWRERVPARNRAAAICFHFANATYHRDHWFDALLQDTAVSAPALLEFWDALIAGEAHMLPGLRKIIAEPDHAALSAQVIIPVMQRWTRCKLKTFIELVFAALRYTPHAQLVETVRELIRDPDAIKDESKRVYWLAMGFVLAPDEFAQPLATYIGRVKQKVLPLLDFVMKVTDPANEIGIEFSPMMNAHLLRIVAPIFPPQEHSYGHMGGIDVNSRNVMRLFHKLATHSDPDTLQAIKWLRKARVMKIYADVLKQAEALQKQLQSDSKLTPPDFITYLTALEDDNKLVKRANRFDIK